jgi:hypothetical protein
MAGIKDLFSLFYWMNNQKVDFLDASIEKHKPGKQDTDNCEQTNSAKAVKAKLKKAK